MHPANASLPMGVFPRAGHISAVGMGDAEAGEGTPRSRPDWETPAKHCVPKEKASVVVHNPKASTGQPIYYYILGAGHCFAGGWELGGATSLCRRRGQGWIPGERLHQPPAQPWTTQEPETQHPPAGCWAQQDPQGMGWTPQGLGVKMGEQARPPPGRATGKPATLQPSHTCANCLGPASVTWIF